MWNSKAAVCTLVVLSLLSANTSARGTSLGRRGDASTTDGRALQQPTIRIQIGSSFTPQSAVSTTNLSTQTHASSATNTNSLASSLSATTTGFGTKNIYHGGLPLRPKITPGLSIAGVVLIVSGTTYCLVGIKIKLLQIFLSSAFLSGLGVTVLVVYVITPPVSNAIEGAHVTAAIVTGMLVGGLACIFPEVTEGLGCLLGGFCLSMWFLVLKPGGLVTSTYGKLIMIAVCSLTLFIPVFHHTTRPYSLIFSLSFAGATTTVLGIDCFSRAGLKEFWLYIWNLNSRMFPYDTNTYPHTRGIRVEIAAIVLVAALGVMSQVKLFKILTERRAVKQAEKRQQEACLETQDGLAGQRIMEQVDAERAQWEEIYGNKENCVSVDERSVIGGMSNADSVVGADTTNGRSGETIEEFVETTEMRKEREEHIKIAQDEAFQLAGKQGDARDGVAAKSTSAPSRTRSASTDTVGVVPRYTTEENPTLSESHSGELSAASYYSRSLVKDVSNRPSTGDLSYELEHSVVRPLKTTPIPQVIPLPLPYLPASKEAGHSEDGVTEDMSQATFADTEDMRDERATFDNRIEDAEDEERLSSVVVICDNLRGPRNELLQKLNRNSMYSLPSSPLATQEVGDREISEENSPSNITSELRGYDKHLEEVYHTLSSRIVPDCRQQGEETPNTIIPNIIADSTDKPAEGEDSLINSSIESVSSVSEKQGRAITRSTNPTSKNLSAPSLKSSHEPSSISLIKDCMSKESLSSGSKGNFNPLLPEIVSEPSSLPDNRPLVTAQPRTRSERSLQSGPALASDIPEFTPQFQSHYSKMLKTYRTNEWAKHLSDAETPELDDLHITLPAASDGMERPAPLRIEALQETSTIPTQTASQGRSKSSPSSIHEDYSHPKNFTQSIIPSVSNSSTSNPNFTAYRLPESAAASPVEVARSVTKKDHIPTLPLSNRDSPKQFSQDTLMSQRNSIVRSRASFCNREQQKDYYLPTSSSTLAINTLRPSATLSFRNQRTHLGSRQSSLPLFPAAAAENNLTLVSRASNARLSSPTLNDETPMVDRRELLHHSWSQQILSERPIKSQKRRSISRQPELMKSWRHGVRADLVAEGQAKGGTGYADQRHTEMVNERNQTVVLERQKTMQGYREDGLNEERMRQPDMLELHKEALRRMQADANKHL